MSHELANLTNLELLQLHSDIVRELRSRQVIRTSNVVGDYAEYLAARCMNLQLSGNSTKGYDATDEQGVHYQVKGRHLTAHNTSTQLGSVRDLDKQDFDFLIGILFNPDYTVKLAAKIPHDTVKDHARPVARSNSHRILLQGSLLADPRVQDITPMFAEFGS